MQAKQATNVPHVQLSHQAAGQLPVPTATLPSALATAAAGQSPSGPHQLPQQLLQQQQQQQPTTHITSANSAVQQPSAAQPGLNSLGGSAPLRPTECIECHRSAFFSSRSRTTAFGRASSPSWVQHGSTNSNAESWTPLAKMAAP